MAIQLLRGTTAQIASNSNTSLAGQPLYDIDKHILYIGDGETAINELEGTKIGLYTTNGSSLNSIQLKANNTNFTSPQDNNDYANGAYQVESINLSGKGHVSRPQSINVGNLNVITTSTTQPLDADEGTITVGYKHFTDSRGSALFGAWQKVVNSKNTISGGYSNQTINCEKSINLGSNNIIENADRCYALGDNLRCNARWQVAVGRFNNPNESGADAGYNQLLFSVGAGSSNTARKNALAIFSNGRAVLNRSSIANNYISSNDILIKSEIEEKDDNILQSSKTYTDTQREVAISTAESYTDINIEQLKTPDIVAESGFIKSIKQTDGIVSATYSNETDRLIVYDEPVYDYDVIRLQEWREFKSLINKDEFDKILRFDFSDFNRVEYYNGKENVLVYAKYFSIDSFDQSGFFGLNLANDIYTVDSDNNKQKISESDVVPYSQACYIGLRYMTSEYYGNEVYVSNYNFVNETASQLIFDYENPTNANSKIIGITIDIKDDVDIIYEYGVPENGGEVGVTMTIKNRTK